METRRSSSCPHLKTCKWTELESDAVLEKIKQCRKSNCSDCNTFSSHPIYMCFMQDCGKLGCNRDVKGHALKHYQANPTHTVALNCFSIQLWCYQCDDYVSLPRWLKKISSQLEDSDEMDIVTNSIYPAATMSSVGLSNIGNSCFINSALQIMFNCPSFMGFFRTCTAFVASKESHTLSHCFQQLVEAIGTTDRSAISPARFIKVAAGFNPAFHGYSQQDSMDFIRMLLDRFHEELKYGVPQEVFESQSAKNRRKSGRLASKNNESIGNHTTYKSIISDTFSGYLRSEVQCHKCKKVSVKDDQFFDLSLPITPGPMTKGMVSNLFSSIGESLGIGGKDIKLESTFVNFCMPELLDGKDRYMCEHCKQLVQSTKTLSLKSLPQILCLQLKRFRHDTYFSSKVNSQVEFPLNGLDLRHFINKEFIGKYVGSSTEYDLLGIINHRGSFNGGHYIAYCRNFETGNWLEFDDSRVKNVHEEDILNVQAYCLFYIRRPDNKFNMENVDLEADTLSSEQAFVSKQWFNRFVTCCNPGPIDGFDVICPHGNIRPLDGLATIESILQPLPKPVASDLIDHFGELGGIGIIEHPIECTVCIEEAEAMRKRRRKEETDVMDMDTSHIGDGEFWYLIDSMWLQSWIDFKSGGPIPGPISNHRLIKNCSPTALGSKSLEMIPKANLIRGEHYRGINERVWTYLYNIYGGGPIIKRRSINIYAE